MITITVEDGSGTNPNANSYISLADAVTYHASRLYTDEWDAADADKRSQAIVMATRVIDSACIFRGYKKIMTQALQWPRVRARNDEYAGQIAFPFPSLPYIYYDENVIPPRLAQAVALEALELLRGDRSADQGGQGLSSLGLGQSAVSLVFNAMTTTRSTSNEVRHLLSPLVRTFRGTGSGMKRITRVR